MTSQDSAAADLEQASEQWLAWLTAETTGRRDPPGSALTAAEGPTPSGSALVATEGSAPTGSALVALWDALEEWFASDDFAVSPLAAAVVAPPDGRGPAAHAALSAGARDPAALAGQLLTLVEGAMAGALVDRHPGVARHARELTRIALAAAAAHG
jgi:hypothetical protein